MPILPERQHVTRQAKPFGAAWFREVVDEARVRHAKRQKPASWIARKFMIGVVAALAIYTYYVYIATFCVPMITGTDRTFGGRAMGIAFLVVQCLLGFMFWWTYFMVCWRGPGMAKDHVSKTPAPGSRVVPTADDDLPDSAIGTPYEYEGMSQVGHTSAPSGANPASPSVGTSRAENPSSPRSRRALPSPPPWGGRVEIPAPPAPPAPAALAPPRTTAAPTQPNDPQVGDISTVIPGVSGATRAPPQPQATQGRSTTEDPQRTLLGRRPPSTPVLRPEHRYCYKDGFIKPPRAHHCRSCGTCVLKYDHHCPWIGQCVGAFNHKFFVNFLSWCTLFSLWIFLTLVIPNAIASRNMAFNINGQQVAVMALSGLFTFFTIMLLISHVRLILTNCSTVESLHVHRMKERERSTLNNMTSVCDFAKRRHIKAEWDREWGRVGTEGNLWWLEGGRQNWEAVMGRSVWWWFLPIGKSDTDGLNWPRNPRFAEDGRWRRRAEWPEEYR